MATKTSIPERVAIRGVGWRKPLSVAAAKYGQISRAILAVLSTEPLRFAELAGRVAQRLPNFEGSVSWYTVSVARELEIQGKLVRHGKPPLYAMAGTPVSPASKRTEPARRPRSSA